MRVENENLLMSVEIETDSFLYNSKNIRSIDQPCNQNRMLTRRFAILSDQSFENITEL